MMTSLHNRATPSQAKILRAVEGAAKNAGDAHPEWKITPHVARSIAKRAAGTLTAQWPDVLAARELSVSGGMSLVGRGRRQAAQPLKRAGRGALRSVHGRSPIIRLRSQLARQMRDVKNSGNTERAEAFIDVLRMIAALLESEPA
jgi:hypothetical protein